MRDELAATDILPIDDMCPACAAEALGVPRPAAPVDDDRSEDRAPRKAGFGFRLVRPRGRRAEDR